MLPKEIKKPLQGVTLTDEDTLCPVANQFSEGVYARTIFMPKGAMVVGKKHKTRHFNFIMTGEAWLWMDGKKSYIKAPHLLESLEGVRKVLHIVEDMHWTTIHATESTDIDEIELKIIEENTDAELLADVQQYIEETGE